MKSVEKPAQDEVTELSENLLEFEIIDWMPGSDPFELSEKLMKLLEVNLNYEVMFNKVFWFSCAKIDISLFKKLKFSWLPRDYWFKIPDDFDIWGYVSEIFNRTLAIRFESIWKIFDFLKGSNFPALFQKNWETPSVLQKRIIFQQICMYNKLEG